MSNLDGWTDDQHAGLVRLAAQGLTAREIAKAIGKSRNAVIGRAARRKVALEYKRPPPEPRAPRQPAAGGRDPSGTRHRRAERLVRHAIVRAMYLAGDTYTAIMNETGYATAASIIAITKGLPRRRYHETTKRYPLSVKIDAVASLLTGERLADLHRRSGIPRESLHRWARLPRVLNHARPIADNINALRLMADETARAVEAQNAADELERITLQNAPILARMPERARSICERRVAGETLAEIGELFGVTRERVRQIEAKWRLAGLEIPGAKPLGQAAERYGAAPTGRPAGRPRKHPLPDFWQTAHSLLDEPKKGRRRKNNMTPEGRAAQSANMARLWERWRAEGAPA